MNFRAILPALILIASSVVQAGRESGGGDLCEARIKIIRDDLKTWINKGGPKDLTLPPNLTLTQYSEAILTQINNAKIRCVGQGDEGYPVEIGGTAKVCRFDIDSAAAQITCDYNKFQTMNESNQYILVHHEYAGLAGIELPNGDSSTYKISNQMSGYLVSEVVKRLAVKPTSSVSQPHGPTADCPRPISNIAALFQIIEDPQQGVPELTAFLDEHIISMDVVNEYCEMPRFAAIRVHKLPVYQMLSEIPGAAGVNKPSSSNRYTLYKYALLWGDFPTIKFIENQGGSIDWDSIERFPLTYAVQANSLDVIKSLLEQCPSCINSGTDSTPLINASTFNTADVVGFLLRKGALVNSTDSSGRTALTRAVQNKWEISELLIRAGADLEGRRDLKSATPLTDGVSMCGSDDPYICDNVLNLIRLGANVNSSANGYTVLCHAASSETTPEVIQALLTAGADKNAKCWGETAYERAVEYKRSREILRLLKP